MPQPNILFLLSDEHGFRYMGHVPHEEGGEPVDTPTLDHLAAQGVVFTDAYCQMPLCTPSRMCLLTGLQVRRCGAWNNESVLRPELDTLPRALVRAGYETCLVGKMHLGGSVQFAGFQHRPYGDLTGHTGHQWEPIDSPARRGMRARTELSGVSGVPESLLQEQVVARETLAWLREHRHRHPERPWFTCASFSRPHFPLTAPRRWIDRYWPDGVTEPRVPAGGDAYDHPMSAGMRRGFRTDEIGPEETMRARGAYMACVSYLDEVLGDLLLQLEAVGLLDNTIVVYTTDHGEMGGEHGTWWKNGWYEACTRVPLILSLPEQRAGAQPARRCRTPVALVDLFPTLCTLAGAPVPAGLDGADLSGVVRGVAEAPERPICCDVLRPRWGAGTEFRSIRWRRWKYVVFRDAPPLFFDLQADPGEQCNLLQRGVEGEAVDALAVLERVARTSIDFEGAAHERTVRDGDLSEVYAQQVPPSTGNLYLMPDAEGLPRGRLVNADDVLYAPTMIADPPQRAFVDWPYGEAEG
jgi:choline-sulfatase